MYTAKFRVKKETEFKGVTIFEGSFNVYENDILVNSWPVMSGKWGKGAIPYGIYLISAPRVLKNTPANKSFKKEGIPWICNLRPQFKTERTLLCLHPDGGIYGTLGCVGVQEKDMLLLELLKKAFEKTLKIPLVVEKYIA